MIRTFTSCTTTIGVEFKLVPIGSITLVKRQCKSSSLEIKSRPSTYQLWEIMLSDISICNANMSYIANIYFMFAVSQIWQTRYGVSTKRQLCSGKFNLRLSTSCQIQKAQYCQCMVYNNRQTIGIYCTWKIQTWQRVVLIVDF